MKRWVSVTEGVKIHSLDEDPYRYKEHVSVLEHSTVWEHSTPN